MTKYDPNVKYGWEKDTKFELTGNEFGLILNTLRTVLKSPEAQKILILNEANKTIETVLSRNVESGVVTPSKIETDSSLLPKSMKVVVEEEEEEEEDKKDNKK